MDRRVSCWLTRLRQEYQENESALTVEDVEINQTVNLFGCKNTTVIVKGKANAVTMSAPPSAPPRPLPVR